LNAQTEHDRALVVLLLIDLLPYHGALSFLGTLEMNGAIHDLAEHRVRLMEHSAAIWQGFRLFAIETAELDPDELVAEHYPLVGWVASLEDVTVDPRAIGAHRDGFIERWRAGGET
jgi:hypothetical protein